MLHCRAGDVTGEATPGNSDPLAGWAGCIKKVTRSEGGEVACRLRCVVLPGSRLPRARGASVSCASPKAVLLRRWMWLSTGLCGVNV